MKKKNNNKGKVYPSPSSPSSPSPGSSSSSYDFGPHRDALSVFKVLPLTILALASVLSLEDREVLAYLITRTIVTNPAADSKKKKHKSPNFECGCFDCYTIFWVRWDLSPNRQFIHQAIEAFEEDLTNLELLKSSSTSTSSGGKKRADRRISSNDVVKQSISYTESPSLLPVVMKSLFRSDDLLLGSGNEGVEMEGEVKEGSLMQGLMSSGEAETGEMVVAVMKKKSEEEEYKGLVRKVLPDVLGLFNSRLWNLIWGPNV